MDVIADLHIHSRYSRAVSKKMKIEEIVKFAKMKGLHIMGTGDFTHPKWLKELQEKLTFFPDEQIYFYNGIFFVLSTEVCTAFEKSGKKHLIHHVILAPNFEVVKQINSRLSKYGSLSWDGRPVLEMTAAELVEEVMEVSELNEIFPAHAWTPWFSLFGEFSGFDTIEDCYEDMLPKIHALETGLSSDPAMNWRLSSLDRFTLLSNSDSHSFWPWRIGREANVFSVDKVSYREIIRAIREKRIKFTIEVDPAYGKYHWSGHRHCNVCLSPSEALRFNNICPVCRRKLTKGVAQRVEELADRPEGYVPATAIPFVSLLPLSEIIAKVIGVKRCSDKKVWMLYNKLIFEFGTEYNVLLWASREQLATCVGERLAEAIIRVRERKIKILPGYDGVYGKIIIFPEEEKGREGEKGQGKHQTTLADFY